MALGERFVDEEYCQPSICHRNMRSSAFQAFSISVRGHANSSATVRSLYEPGTASAHISRSHCRHISERERPRFKVSSDRYRRRVDSSTLYPLYTLGAHRWTSLNNAPLVRPVLLNVPCCKDAGRCHASRRPGDVGPSQGRDERTVDNCRRYSVRRSGKMEGVAG